MRFGNNVVYRCCLESNADVAFFAEKAITSGRIGMYPVKWKQVTSCESWGKFASDDLCFPSEMEAGDLVHITEKAMMNLFHQGGTTSLAPASSLDRLGPKGAMLFQYFLYKVKLQVK